MLLAAAPPQPPRPHGALRAALFHGGGSGVNIDALLKIFHVQAHPSATLRAELLPNAASPPLWGIPERSEADAVAAAGAASSVDAQPLGPRLFTIRASPCYRGSPANTTVAYRSTTREALDGFQRFGVVHIILSVAAKASPAGRRRDATSRARGPDRLFCVVQPLYARPRPAVEPI